MRGNGRSSRRRIAGRARWLFSVPVCLLLLFHAAAAPSPDETEGEVVDGLPEVIPAPENPLERYVEVGAGYGKYTEDYGTANGQFVRLGWTRPQKYSWRLDLGRERRFNETSLGIGASFTRYLPKDASVTIGAGTGTGDVLAPEYRIGISASRPFFGVIFTLGYDRNQSKAENRSDGVVLGMQRWFPHWIVDAWGRYDRGYPGDTETTSGGIGITYYVWKKLYIGVGAEFGDVSYLLVEPDEAQVDYHAEGYNLGCSYWLNSRSGLNFRLGYGDAGFYRVKGATLSYFREW